MFFFDLVHAPVRFRKKLFRGGAVVRMEGAPHADGDDVSPHTARLASNTARVNRFSISATRSFVISGRTKTNSSPPRRPTWSYSRQEDLNFAATSEAACFRSSARTCH